MDFRTQLLADVTAPRYTSYPTAPHFAPEVGADIYAAWLAELSPQARLSLYLHVPFCAHICFYCGCHTKAAARRGPVDIYADRLLQEIPLAGKATAARFVTGIHWGGGTPSILESTWLTTVHRALADTFDIQPDVEHAFECDPRKLTPELAETLAAIGVNRASLGVQDLNPHVQVAMGRVQPFETVARAVTLLREVGIERLNFDLMYGLPSQTVDDVRSSLTQAISLRPQRLALFGYAHVPWFKSNQRLIDAETLASPAERLEQAEAGRELLIAAGYRAIGLDHFALPDDDLSRAAAEGQLRRNFQGYTTDQADALLGFGVSAIGRVPQGFVQNAADHASYGRALAAGRLPIARGLAFTPEDRIRGRLIEELMCGLPADAGPAWSSAPEETERHERERLEPYMAEGMVRLEGSRVIVTDAGRPFVRLIAAVFDTRLARSQTRHSTAV